MVALTSLADALVPYIKSQVAQQMDQQAQAANPMYMYQPGASIPYAYQQLGSAITTGWSDTTSTITTTGDVHCGGTVYANGFGNTLGQMWQGAYKKMIKFFRVNEVVEVEELSVMQDPLDELRIKVMRWLDGCKVTV
jgi:hypothetical protein